MIEPLRRDIEQLIKLTAAQLGLSVQLALRQCEAESGFNYISANPSRGAVGLFGVTKARENELNTRIIKEYQTKLDFLRGVRVKRDDWRSSIFGGLMYMRWLVDRFNGDRCRDSVARALAAYYCDYERISTLIEKHGPVWWAFLPREAGEYLQQILGVDAPNAHVDYKVA